MVDELTLENIQSLITRAPYHQWLGLKVVADWAMVRKTGRGVPTIDLRVDYHAAAMPGDLTAKGKMIRFGGQFSTAEAHVFDAAGKLLASGRGTYLTAPPPPPKG